MIRRLYGCSQSQLYAAARIGWGSCKEHLTRFTNFKSFYTANFIDDRLDEINQAENQPDTQARTEIFESLRVEMQKHARQCLHKWQSLKRYIASAYPHDVQKPKCEAAGANHYPAAGRFNWEEVRALMTSGNQFIINQLAELQTGGNMPDSFPAEFLAVKDAFDQVHLRFIHAEEEARVKTEEKVVDNNTIYTALITMFLDGQDIFRDTALEQQFVFESVLGLVNGSGPAGLQGVILSVANDKPVPEAVISIPGLSLTAVSDTDGSYVFKNIPSGTYNISIAREGYQTLNTEVVIPVGTTVTRDFTLLPS